MTARPPSPPTIAVFGYLSLDTLMREGTRIDDVPGGGALYAALGVLAAGGVPVLHAARPADFPGSVLAQLASLGADLSQLRAVPDRTRRAMLIADGEDRRSSPHHQNAVWRDLTDRLAPSPPDETSDYDAAILCPMPIASALAIAAVLDPAAKIVLDTSEAYARDHQADLDRLLVQADVFAPSLAETRLLHPDLDDDASAAELSRSVRLVVQTRGPDGLAAYASGTLIARRAADLVRAVDTTGAGDATCGALAVAAARGLDLADTLDLAAHVGARAVCALGPVGLGLDLPPEENARCA